MSNADKLRNTLKGAKTLRELNTTYCSLPEAVRLNKTALSIYEEYQTDLVLKENAVKTSSKIKK